jgi:hypothetical protein
MNIEKERHEKYINLVVLNAPCPILKNNVMVIINFMIKMKLIYMFFEVA